MSDRTPTDPDQNHPHNAPDQQSRQMWDAEAAAFDNEPDHGLRDAGVRAAWTALLSDSLPDTPDTPLRILDIGCGTGSLSLVLAGLGHDVTGIDFSPEMIARAKEKAQAAGQSIEFQVMDAAAPQFPSQEFDVLLCRHVLWTLPEPDQVLLRWQQLLKPGGRLIMIEGFWHTGAGLHAEQITDALPAAFTSVSVQNLSDRHDLWGGRTDDERYLIRADVQV